MARGGMGKALAATGLSHPADRAGPRSGEHDYLRTQFSGEYSISSASGKFGANDLLISGDELRESFRRLVSPVRMSSFELAGQGVVAGR